MSENGYLARALKLRIMAKEQEYRKTTEPRNRFSIGQQLVRLRLKLTELEGEPEVAQSEARSA